MKNVMIFYLEGCPYCRDARRALSSLLEEKPEYAGIGVRWVEENRERETAERYEYYYVPSVFAGEKKLYEAHPSESCGIIREKLDAALAAVLKEN